MTHGLYTFFQTKNMVLNLSDSKFSPLICILIDLTLCIVGNSRVASAYVTTTRILNLDECSTCSFSGLDSLFW